MELCVVSMELWARHMGRHCVVDKIVTFWGREFPFFSDNSSYWLVIIKCTRAGVTPLIVLPGTSAGSEHGHENLSADSNNLGQ